MQLSEHGTIKHDGYNIMRTECGRWAISQPSTTGSKHVGYVDMLEEVDAFLAQRKHNARAKLAEVQAKHDARMTEESMRKGEGQGIDPNH